MLIHEIYELFRQFVYKTLILPNGTSYEKISHQISGKNQVRASFEEQNFPDSFFIFKVAVIDDLNVVAAVFAGSRNLPDPNGFVRGAGCQVGPR